MRTLRWCCLSLPTVLVLAVPARSQNNWQTIPPGPAPLARQNHCGAYDMARGRSVIHGGDNGTMFGDTWEFDGSSWRAMSPPTSPGPRWAAAMGYDPVTTTTILYGGSAVPSGPPVAETWRWNGTTWTLLQPATSPPALLAHAMATDLAGSRIVLFGGRDQANTARAETWAFDGTTWTRLPGPQPPPRCCHDLAFDLTTGAALLFGGWSGATLGDTWEFIANTWVQRLPATVPGPRWGYRSAMVLQLGGVVMHGGTAGTNPHGETWLWRAGNWQQLTPANPGPIRANHVMHRNWALDRVVLYGGGGSGPGWPPQNDTWTFGAPIPASFTPMGSGCAGPAGLPQLTALGQPWIGTNPVVNLAPVPILGLFVLGWSNTVSGTQPLPAALAGFGMPGCLQLVSLDAVVARSPAAGTAALTIPIPFQPSLANLPFFLQGASLDPGANALGLTVSGGLAAVIGWQ